MYFSRLGIGSYRRIGLFVDQILQGILHLALRHTTKLYHLRTDHPGSQCIQIRKHLLFEHGNQFRRGARQQHNTVLLRLQNNARRCSIIIVQHLRSLWHHGLFPVVLRGLNISDCEKFGNALHAVIIHREILSTDFRHSLLGQIILRGSQSTR